MPEGGSPPACRGSFPVSAALFLLFAPPPPGAPPAREAGATAGATAGVLGLSLALDIAALAGPPARNVGLEGRIWDLGFRVQGLG